MLIKSFKADSLTVNIHDSRTNMGQAAAADAADCLRHLLATQNDVYAVFAAAPSQNEFLAALAAAEGIDWTRVHALHMDEYVGLAADAPQGFGNFLRRGIFDRLPFASVEYIGTSTDSEAALSNYDAILAAHPIDVVFMGIGENGHIAFNDPHVADFNDPKRIKKVDLDLKCRMQQVNDGCFAALDEVPEYALTLTVPTLFSGKRLFCIVPAPSKADAVKATVEGPVDESCPASILRRHPAAALYLDTDSGKYLSTEN
ncbi:MAG: 6-phosphogluconolactonase [Alistipes sp.]|nr:6-phosphogluconolactonase [Alistipes sp.]